MAKKRKPRGGDRSATSLTNARQLQRVAKRLHWHLDASPIYEGDPLGLPALHAAFAGQSKSLDRLNAIRSSLAKVRAFGGDEAYKHALVAVRRTVEAVSLDLRTTVTQPLAGPALAGKRAKAAQEKAASLGGRQRALRKLGDHEVLLRNARVLRDRHPGWSKARIARELEPAAGIKADSIARIIGPELRSP